MHYLKTTIDVIIRYDTLHKETNNQSNEFGLRVVAVNCNCSTVQQGMNWCRQLHGRGGRSTVATQVDCLRKKN